MAFPNLTRFPCVPPATVEHICRISRIIDTPRGNALLVGVGGSGKQSLTRLAAFISTMQVFQLKLTASYGMGDFKTDMITLYQLSLIHI